MIADVAGMKRRACLAWKNKYFSSTEWELALYSDCFSNHIFPSFLGRREGRGVSYRLLWFGFGVRPPSPFEKQGLSMSVTCPDCVLAPRNLWFFCLSLLEWYDYRHRPLHPGKHGWVSWAFVFSMFSRAWHRDPWKQSSSSVSYVKLLGVANKNIGHLIRFQFQISHKCFRYVLDTKS